MDLDLQPFTTGDDAKVYHTDLTLGAVIFKAKGVTFMAQAINEAFQELDGKYGPLTMQVSALTDDASFWWVTVTFARAYP